MAWAENKHCVLLCGAYSTFQRVHVHNTGGKLASKNIQTVIYSNFLTISGQNDNFALKSPSFIPTRSIEQAINDKLMVSSEAQRLPMD